jgi:large subunit ribosomal protein L24
MKIKKDDNIIVISGKDRGKQAKVLKVVLGESKIIAEGIGLKKKHQRPKKSGQKGQVVTLPAPVDSSNVMLYCKNCGKGVRTGYLLSGDTKSRICKKCKNEI